MLLILTAEATVVSGILQLNSKMYEGSGCMAATSVTRAVTLPHLF